MSKKQDIINEQDEFEAINHKTSERNAVRENTFVASEAFRIAKRNHDRKKAIGRMVTVGALGIAALFGIYGLKHIGWLMGSLPEILMVIVEAVAMYKIGYLAAICRGCK